MKRGNLTHRPHAAIPLQRIEEQILVIRGQKVLLDHDLADLYDVSTKSLNQAVKRNNERFPVDFMFRLSPHETQELNRSQTVTGSQKHRDPRFPPFAFTEQGVAMLSSVLRSERAVAVNIQIMRTFVKLRGFLGTQKELARKLAELERQYADHDQKIEVIFEAIRELMAPEPLGKKKRIGFIVPEN
jgi:hypothetical protein